MTVSWHYLDLLVVQLDTSITSSYISHNPLWEDGGVKYSVLSQLKQTPHLHSSVHNGFLLVSLLLADCFLNLYSTTTYICCLLWSMQYHKSQPLWKVEYLLALILYVKAVDMAGTPMRYWKGLWSLSPDKLAIQGCSVENELSFRRSCHSS